MNEYYDYIILGGGLAGLSLAYQLIDSPLGDRSILIVEPDDKGRNDRTFCFWSDRSSPFDALVYRSWDQIRFSNENDQRTINLGDYRYQMIRSIDFYRHTREVLAVHTNVTFVRGYADRVEEIGEGACVFVHGEKYTGGWVFDSRFKLAQFKADPANTAALYQHFTGWLIETPDGAFDPTATTLFDFRVPGRNELRFCYVLPLSTRRALVELVALSPHQLEPTLKDYVENTLGLRDYRVIEEEGGVSPLIDRPCPRRVSTHVMTIGTAGGRIKASSGYAFTRIQHDSAAIVQSLIKTGQPFHVPADSSFFRLCDTLLLHIMRERGATIQLIFTIMFRRNPAGRIFRFLDEASSVVDTALIIANMPPRPFLQALCEYAALNVRRVMTNAVIKIKTSRRHVSTHLATWLRENS